VYVIFDGLRARVTGRAHARHPGLTPVEAE